MRIAVLDDIHHVFEESDGVRRLRQRVDEVRVFTAPFEDPEALRGYDALVANRGRTRFDRSLLERLADVRIIAQTGNHADHIDLEAAHGLVDALRSNQFWLVLRWTCSRQSLCQRAIHSRCLTTWC